MAPIKRSRTISEAGADISSFVQTRGTVSHKNRKKPRTSISTDIDEEYLSNNDNLACSSPHTRQAHGHDDVEPNPYPATQYELDRDGDFSHLDHEDVDDALATQRLLARSELTGENHAAENGIIESVTMINFMCHERLHVNLGPLINFVIGHNGSGKSAVLTAITLCLGGKASTTNRGGSLKSFIKEGRDHANLIIRLKNEGLDAYQPETFGSSIIVERNFSKIGTSGFKLKSSAGRIISTKKADVEDVVEYFQMQVDNPMNVLTQDAARQFLNAASPAQKYRFFVKGVQLEQLDNDYCLLSQTADAMAVKLEQQSASVAALKQTKVRADEKAEMLNKHAGIKTEIRHLGIQMAWAQVEEEERSLVEQEKRVIEAHKTIEDTEAKLAAKDRIYQQMNTYAERAEEVLKEKQQAGEPLADEETEVNAALTAATQELQNSHLEHRQVRDHLNAAKKKAEGLRKDITIEQRRLEDTNGGAHAQRVNDMDTAQEVVVQTRRDLEQSAAVIPQLEDQRHKALDAARDAGQPIEKKKQEIRHCETQMRIVSRDSEETMVGFDTKMPRLLHMIADDRGFREKPVGPIGMHIRLTKPIWSAILERSIGNVLNGFVVTSKADQQRLSGLMHQLHLENCPILIGNHSQIDISGKEPDEQYDTVLRVLDIDNDLVKRQLIIGQAIEQTVLIESYNDASRIMYDRGRPRNTKQCFCLSDHRRNWGVRLGYMQGTSEGSTGPIQPTGRRPRMKTNAESQVQYFKETLEHLQKELAQLQNEQRQMQQAVQRCSQTLVQHRRGHDDLRVKLQRAEDHVEHIQEDLDRDNVEDGRLAGLKDYLEETENEIRLHEGSYGEAALAKEKQVVNTSELKEKLETVRLSRADHADDVKKLAEKAQRKRQARQLALQDKNLADHAITGAQNAKLSVEQKRDKQMKRVNDFARQATIISTRVSVDDGQNAASLEAKITKLKEQLRCHNQRLGGTDEEILEAQRRARETFKMAESQYKELLELLRLLKDSYLKRIDMWRKFQRHISARSRINFTYLLSERGFRGKLIIDHKHKLLDLKVEPDETTKSGKGRQTKTLSGGEKSFSSICLLLGLWEAMGAPLRCLDEFDVFMDSVNRDVSTKMIIGAARRSVAKQFIIITPNAIGGSAEHDRDVKLIKLSDPRQQHLVDL